MIEKIIDFLISKNSINNSKLISILTYLIIGILASTWYSYSIQKYTINFDYKYLIDFIFSGKIIPCLIFYGLVYLIYEILGPLFYMIYSLILFPIIKCLHFKKLKKGGKIRNSKDYFQIRDIIRPILINLGVLILIKNELYMQKGIREIIIRYCNSPRAIVVNLIQMFVLLLMYHFAYNINILHLNYIPHCFNSFITIIYWSLFIIFFVVLIFLSIFEFNIPALRKVYEKTKSLE